MAVLAGEQASFTIDVLSRHIPEGINSWENNWLEAEFACTAGNEAVRFATRRLTVHDIYDLYFHLGISLQGLSPAGVFVPLLQRQLKLKLSPEDGDYRVSIEMTGCPELDFGVTREEVVNFSRDLRQILSDYPLRADEVPSVAPVIEFYSTRQWPERLQLPRSLWAALRSLFKVSNPIGRGRGDAIRFTFTLSRPVESVGQRAIADFFAARDYQVRWQGDVLRANRGGTSCWKSLDGKGLPTEVQYELAETHSIVTYDVWTAGIRQSSRKLFAWVGEAAMLEVFLAGCKGFDYVRERLAIMDSNLRRASQRDLIRLAVVLVGLAAVLLLMV